MSETGKVLGVTTTSGVAMLPNTGGNMLLTVLSYSLIAVGVVVFTSFVATRLYARATR